MLRRIHALAPLFRALLLLAVSLPLSGCWVLRDYGVDLPGERELKLGGLQELSLRWQMDNYGRPILSLQLPPSGVPCPRVSDSVKVTLGGQELPRKSSGGPFHRRAEFTPSGCYGHAEWWAPDDLSADAELVLSDGERVIKASGPNVFMLRKLTTSEKWKIGATVEVALEPASDRILRASVGCSNQGGKPPVDVPEQSIQYEGNKIRFPAPAAEPGRRTCLVQVYELEAPVARCEGVPRCLYRDGKIQELVVELAR